MDTRTLGTTLLLGFFAASACGDDTGADNGSDGGRDRGADAAIERDAGRAEPRDGGDLPGDPGTGPDPDADGGFTLECMRGAKVSVVHVEFRCSEITVYTCKDLSNIVIEYEDGTQGRIEGTNGHVNSFTGTGANAGKRIVRVWVKAGNNKSGDGPGFGERVDAPPQSCTPPSGGRGGTGGAGNGGTGGTCVPGPDVSCVPIPTSGTGGSGGDEGGPRPD